MNTASKVLGKAVVLVVAASVLLGTIGVSAASAEFGIDSFDGAVSDSTGAAYTTAGGHPYAASTTFDLRKVINSQGNEIPDGGGLKSVRADLPPGFLGNPAAAPQCAKNLRIPALTEVFKSPDPNTLCPISSIVGLATVTFTSGGGLETDAAPVFNIDPPPGVAAQFGFSFLNSVVLLDAHLRSDGDYGVQVRGRFLSQGAAAVGSSVTLWGVPADHSHDDQRCVAFPIPVDFQPIPQCILAPNTPGGPNVANVTPQAFLTNPTACTAPGVGLRTTLRVESWDPASAPDEASFLSHNPPGYPLAPDQWGSQVGPTDCEDVPFEPRVSAQPTTAQADTPSGLDVDISVPTGGLLNPKGIAQSTLKQAVVTLPEGMSVNPSSASGLGSCSPSDLAKETAASGPGEGCPLSSKIGTVSVETPLLEQSLDGSVYLAKQNDNPFNSLLALYIVVKSPERGVIVKLSGEVSPDPVSGRLVTSFDDNPQLPFSSLRLELKSGSRAPLITPPACGTYSTTAALSPWARPESPVSLRSSFSITSGPGGGPCPAPATLAPLFEAGTLTPIAGTYSPLVINASRPDGSEPLTGLRLSLPEGLTGKLAGVPYCPEAAIAAAIARSQPGQGALELASPSCPAASKVGSVDVGAGAGPLPYHVRGAAYLAGPYKGAPISMAVITPALAGPFDLGVVVVRAALRVDPANAQITAISDPIPTILHGIPLKVRSISVSVDRPEFTLNPTSCDPMALSAALFGTSAVAPVSSRFQVGACGALDFKPKLSLRLSGPTRRSKNPALRAVLTQAPGQANIDRVSVVLPKSAFIDNAHISNPCTRVQFNANACPPKSILGYARAFTPLLAEPLEGPVYFRSNGGERELPDLVADLNGQIHVTLVGYVDSVGKKGSETSRVRNTFALVPDAPVSKFVLSLKGGKVGLIENSANLCEADQHAVVKMDAQSGKAYDTRPLVKVDCGKGRARR